MTLPVQPVIVAPCEHLFCRGCISQALERRCECPVDRQDVEDLEALKKGTLMYRVWSAIPVKCGNHESCAWTGSVGDYSNHADICLEATARRGRHTTDSAEKEINSLKRKLQEVERECAVLQEESTSHDTVNLPCLFNGSYEYRRENVAKLSQLISRYLEGKPDHIDANRIYNCVRNCYMDWKRKHSDNPRHYNLDMKMLLTTCAASTWFTTRQLACIRGWIQESIEKGW